MRDGDADLAFASLGDLRRLLRTRKISSTELTRHALDRLAAGGPRYNALAELTAALALEQARRADHRLRRGTNATPLTGIPYGAKDLLATKGIPTRWGAPPFRDQVFDYDATVIARLRDAGAVLVGKLAMVELAGGGAVTTTPPRRCTARGSIPGIPPTGRVDRHRDPAAPWPPDSCRLRWDPKPGAAS